MKVIKLAAIALIASAAFLSCKKSKVEPAANPYSGSYKGKFGLGTSTPTTYYFNQLNSDGTLYEEGGSQSNPNKANGTWTMEGNIFKSKVTYYYGGTSSYSMLGTYDPALHTITGTWGYGDSRTDGGKFYFTKQ